MADDIKIVAVVQFNQGEALVLSREPNMLYEFHGKDLIGEDGPFRYRYGYSAPSGRFRAFAGRKFNIPLKDGSTVEASGQYWDCALEGFVSVTYSTIEDLQKCYVFTGAMIDPEWLSENRAAYTGVVYPYWDYEKIIKYDKERRYWINRSFKLERDKKHLIKSVKDAHRQLREVPVHA